MLSNFWIREITVRVFGAIFLVKLGRRTHVDELVVTRCVVSDFLNKVNLRIIEQLVNSSRMMVSYIHHLDFFQFNQLKDTARCSNQNFWSFLRRSIWRF